VLSRRIETNSLQIYIYNKNCFAYWWFRYALSIVRVTQPPNHPEIKNWILIMLSPLSLSPSFGFGDRLGLATPGHIAALRGTKFAPVFAQQSVRENLRTGRTPQQVIDDARRAVEALKWDAPWGADADHLKTLEEITPFVAAGYTFFTVDPGEHVDNAADTDPPDVLKGKLAGMDWDELSALYLNGNGEQPWGTFDAESLMRAAVKYSRAIQHVAVMFKRMSELMDVFDFEMSVDETDAPTTPLEHFFIASELTRLGVKFTSLAPRFIGRFEKGVDYIGDLEALDAELAKHAAVTAHFGTYKLSLHSGSDKFSVYPLMAKHWGERLHVKTAGTSYLEALRVFATYEPDLFLKLYALGRERYETDRLTYHVSAKLEMLPGDDDLPALLDDFHAREVLHVTFGSALTAFGADIKAALAKHESAYYEFLRRHFEKHLRLLEIPK
jgi:tagaturonate epimerase